MSMINPAYLLQTLLPHITQLIGTSVFAFTNQDGSASFTDGSTGALRFTVNAIGVRLLECILQRIPEGSMTINPSVSTSMLDCIRRLSTYLIDVCSFCPELQTRTASRSCFQSLFSVFVPAVRYDLVVPFLDLESSPAAVLAKEVGVQARIYYISRLKDEYVASFVRPGVDRYNCVFFRESSKVLAQLAVILDGLNLGNVDCLETCLQILNFYRFLLLRDRTARLTDIQNRESPGFLKLELLDGVQRKIDVHVDALRKKLADSSNQEQELQQMKQLALPVADLTTDGMRTSLIAKEHRYLLVATVLSRTQEILRENQQLCDFSSSDFCQ
ncbi:MAG: hypothetical protein K2Q09_03645 [Phycisphaerales bacterium]|nr:hypothetical protein [Phycisphaerales bacterium]